MFHPHGDPSEQPCQHQHLKLTSHHPVEQRPKGHQLEETQTDVYVSPRAEENHDRHEAEYRGRPEAGSPVQVTPAESHQRKAREYPHQPVHHLCEAAVGERQAYDVQKPHVRRVKGPRYRRLEAQVVLAQKERGQRQLIGEGIDRTMGRGQGPDKAQGLARNEQSKQPQLYGPDPQPEPADTLA